MSSPAVTSTSSAPAATARRSRVLPVVAIVLAVAVVAVNVFMALHAKIPVLWTDELGYLSNAQVLSGVGVPRDLAGRGYYIGWSLLITPLWWVTTNLEIIYRGAVALSTLFGIGLVWPLALIARRFGLGWAWAVIIGSVVSLAPSRATMSNFALSENFLTFVVALTVVAAFNFAKRKTIASGALLGLAAAGAFTIHGRVVAVAIGAGLWFLWELILRKNWKPALVGLVVLGAVAGGGFLLYRHTIANMYPPSADREATGIDRIFHGNPVAILTSAGGQVWYELAVWGGLALLGGLLLSKYVIREVRARKLGVAFFSLVTLLGVFVVSATWVEKTIAAGRDRLDIYSYGRYLESFGVILAVLGLVALVKGFSLRFGLIAAGIAVVISGIFFLVVAPQAPLGGILFWGPTSIPGLLQWPWPHVTSVSKPPWIYAGIAALLALGATILLRKKPLIVVAIAAVFFASSSVVAEVRTLDPYFSGFYASFGLRHQLAEYPKATLSFDTAGLNDPGETRDSVSRNAYQYWGAPRKVTVFDSTETAPTTQLVIGRKEWPDASKFGAQKLADDTGLFDDALWVMPGSLQDQLASEGKLNG